MRDRSNCELGARSFLLTRFPCTRLDCWVLFAFIVCGCCLHTHTDRRIGSRGADAAERARGDTHAHSHRTASFVIISISPCVRPGLICPLSLLCCLPASVCVACSYCSPATDLHHLLKQPGCSCPLSVSPTGVRESAQADGAGQQEPRYQVRGQQNLHNSCSFAIPRPSRCLFVLHACGVLLRDGHESPIYLYLKLNLCFSMTG